MPTLKPNFFILGAPKCGTTSMNEWLASHPAIFMARKEPHYFNTDHKNRWATQLSDYQALFELASKQHLAIGEASVRYLYSKEAVANILAYNPEAKLVVMLRNPIDMAYSWHNQICFSGLETVRNFKTAWDLQAKRRLGQRIPHGCPEPKMLMYGEVCSLGRQVQNLYRQVDKEQVHLILFDDLKAIPQKTYQTLLKFLAVPDDGKQDFSVHNQAKTYYAPLLNGIIYWLGGLKGKMGLTKGLGCLVWLEKNTSKHRKRPPLSPQMRQTLIQYFTDDIKLLAQLTGRDLSHWIS